MNVGGKLHAVAALLSEEATSIPTEEKFEWATEKVWTLWRRDKSPCCVQNVVTFPWTFSP
jgi:hypothetical protein